MRHVWAGLVIGVVLLLVSASGAAAWSPSAAAHYADSYWHDYSPAWPPFNDDCTDFVSQIVWNGGYSMDYSTNNPWYEYYNYGWHNSLSWSFVQYNNGFFIEDIPGGYVTDQIYGKKTASTHASQGAIVYYAWYDDRTFATNSHAAFVAVTSGRATSTSDVGNLVDAHTNDRYHEYWTLYKWNTHWPTTYYEIVQISTANR